MKKILKDGKTEVMVCVSPSGKWYIVNLTEEFIYDLKFDTSSEALEYLSDC